VPSRGVANAVAAAEQRRRAVAHELREVPVFRRACAQNGACASDLGPRTWHAARAQRIMEIS